MPPAKPKHTSIAEALSTAQSKMGNAVKNSVNPHFKSTFADFPAVRDIVIPALAAEGIACIQHVDGADGKVTVRTTIHWMETTIEAGNCTIKYEGRNAAQAVGSATTYLKRYQLAGLGGVAQVDDDGQSATNEPQTHSNQQPRQAHTQQPKRAPEPPRERPGPKARIGSRPCPECGSKTWDNREYRKWLRANPEQKPIPAMACNEWKTCKWTAWDTASAEAFLSGTDGFNDGL